MRKKKKRKRNRKRSQEVKEGIRPRQGGHQFLGVKEMSFGADKGLNLARQRGY